MQSKKFLSLLTLILINILTINISYSIEPDIFVQSTVNRASSVLSSNYTKQEKIDELKKIATETVDINGIGLYTLGSYRKNISEDEKKEYALLFRDYFLKSFASRLAEYSNPEIQVNSKEKVNKNYTMVSSVLIATEKRPEVKLDWRIYTKNPENPLIRDLIIEGLSLVRTQKEEFSSIIQTNNVNINALFENLKEFAK